jgi:class 3 adenylate cyclase
LALFMDRHHFDDAATWEEIKLAHDKDLALQDQFGVKMLTYWYDEARHSGFCLGETDNKEDLVRLHEQAHGSIPNEVIEVQPELVQAFLGDLPDMNGPAASVTDAVPGTRTIMFTDLVDFTSHTSKLGDAAAMELLRVHDLIVKNAIAANGGRLVKHTGDGIMASFDLSESAVSAAAEVQSAMRAHRDASPDKVMHVRVGLASGEPIEEGGDLFGTSVQLAARLCSLAMPDGVLAAEAVYSAPGAHQELLEPRGSFAPKGFDTPVQAFGLANESR